MLSVFVLTVLASVASGVMVKDMKFTPLDPKMTSIDNLWLGIQNPVPVDYCINGQIYNPSGKIDPSPGPMAFDILESVQTKKGAKPTGSWHKNLWRFPFNDTKWAALYAYPYTVQPRDQYINLMYLGLPGNKYADPPEPINSRVSYFVKNYTADANVTGSRYPIITSSQAWDAGILISNGFASISKLSQTHSIIDYNDQNRITVATVYLHKGSPFINVECRGAQLGIGSLTKSMPPIIEVNGKPPGSTITAKTFAVKAAVGAPHLAGEMWNFYFDTEVTLRFPSNPAEPLTLAALYTGLLQVGAGEKDNVMKPLLDKYHGVYARDAEITYDVDWDAKKTNVNFNWDKVISPGSTNTELMILAIPHHMEVVDLEGMTSGNTSYWCTKGPMKYIVGDVWKTTYNLTDPGFGEDYVVKNATMKTEITRALKFDYDIYRDQCPGDNIFNQSRHGKYNMELYSYIRQLNKYVDLAIVAQSVGSTEIAKNLTAQVANCLLPFTEKDNTPPLPCPAASNSTPTCVRNQMLMYYDKTYGGIITSWYNRFAVLYCEGCKNRDGYYPLANYGNTLYNDHHFQYGFYLRVSSWVLKKHKEGWDIGYTPAQVSDLKIRALAFARDFANPNATDEAFTVMRHKDIYEGHSWAEGLDYNGFVFTWNNQEGGGEAVNAYYSLMLLGEVLEDENIRTWGAINMATEIHSVRKYQHLSEKTPEEPYEPLNKMMKCMPMLQGNGITGTTYYGPQAVFACGAITVPFTPVTRELIHSEWAGEAFEWMDWHNKAGGTCVYPDPINNATNVCPGKKPSNWWGNEYSCCPFDKAPFQPNLWTAYPNWFPVMYLIQGFNDTAAAWESLQIKSEYVPTEKLPFPYMNDYGYAVGYEPALARTWALFLLGTMESSPASSKATEYIPVHVK